MANKIKKYILKNLFEKWLSEHCSVVSESYGYVFLQRKSKFIKYLNELNCTDLYCVNTKEYQIFTGSRAHKKDLYKLWLKWIFKECDMIALQKKIFNN